MREKRVTTARNRIYRKFAKSAAAETLLTRQSSAIVEVCHGRDTPDAAELGNSRSQTR